MAAIRGSGPVAERLRTYVRERVHKDGAHYERGIGLALAAHLRKAPSWASEYVSTPPAANADIDTALAICAFFGVSISDFFVGGPALSRPGSTIAETRKGDRADVPASGDRRHLREIAALKTRITRLEIALHKAGDATREATKWIESVGQSRTPRKRRA